MTNPPTIRRATHLDVAKLVFVGAIWGASFIFIALALKSFGPITVAAGRISLAAVVLLVISFAAGYRLKYSLADWRKMILIGSLNSGLPFFLISWGMQFISSAEAAILMASGTFFALILSHFASSDERFNTNRVIGVSVGFCGVILLVIHDLIFSESGSLKGQIAMILAGLSYASSSVLSRRISHIPALPASASILSCTSIYMLSLAFFFEGPIHSDPEPMAVLALVALGVLGTAIAYVIRLQIIANNGAVFMSQIGYLVPLFAVIWSWLFLSEAIGVATVAALVAILLGIAITRRGT